MNSCPLSSDEILKASCFEVKFGLNGGISMHGMSDGGFNIRNTVYDQRGGVKYSNETCPECGNSGGECTGHFGHITLPYPIINKFYKKNILLQIMNCLCWECLEPLIEADEMSFEELRKLVTEPNSKKERKVRCTIDGCKMKDQVQPFLSSMDGLGLGIVCSATNKKFSLRMLYRPTIKQAKEFQIKDLTSLYNHFNAVFRDDPNFYSNALNLPPRFNPADFIMLYLPVLPTPLRPYTFSDGVNMNDDYITEIYNNIVNIIPEFKNPKNTKEQLEEYQINLNQQIYNLYFSGLKGRGGDGMTYGDIRGLMVRIEDSKKPNIESKRVEFSGRAVIKPLGIGMRSGETVDIPNAISKKLGTTVQVTDENFKVVIFRASTEEVIKIVRPPIRGIGEKFGIVTNMKGTITFKSIPRGGLKVGDFVIFRLKDGDDVIVNRNPTLHAYGILSTKISTNSSQKKRKSGEDSLCVSDQVWGVYMKTSVFNLIDLILASSSNSESSIRVEGRGNFLNITIPFSDEVDDNVINDLRKWCLSDVDCIYSIPSIYGNEDITIEGIALDTFSVERVISTALTNYAKALPLSEQSILLSEGLNLDKISMLADEDTLEFGLASALSMQNSEESYIIIPHTIRFDVLSPRQRDLRSCGIYRFSGSIYNRSISKFAVREGDGEYQIKICTTLIHYNTFLQMLDRSRFTKTR